MTKDDNVTPLPKIPNERHERHTWKCKHCGVSGKAATKKDAKDALKWHMYFNH